MKKIPAFGIWKDKPQTDMEAHEELSKIKTLNISVIGYAYLNKSDNSYSCIDVRLTKNGG